MLGETYYVKTFGCQMNKYDSERVAGLLENAGLQAVGTPDDADVIVFLTCCVREGADERLYGQVASLKRLKTAGKTPLIAVGGCIGQRDGEELQKRIPHIDVVFGTHNLNDLVPLLDQVAEDRTPQVARLQDSSEADFKRLVPEQREHPFHAWLPISVGCNNFCSYCIVPYVRGREVSRPFDEIVETARELKADGVREITLLGQNVNSYGRDLYGEPRFAQVLEAVASTGISRLGFATSHPKDLSDETINTMASTPAVLRYLHLPVQHGNNEILRAMRRVYTREQYLERVESLRAAIPDITLSTDIIVGFPGETEEQFEDTLSLVRQVGFDQAFTFIYSPREATLAAGFPDQIPHEVALERFERLAALVQVSAEARNAALLDTTACVLLEGPSKRNPALMTGRTRGYKLVHVPAPEGTDAAKLVGQELPVRITGTQAFYLQGVLE
ncbi:MAG: tRNA (N6-isopentenyl adenosine(37)-C2)-methylthiotransferase MiaB [Coriobacteriia bacterium]|nr:tRNA (N6-isopentenyl adenosine(37)-C2)-methylthiotransferase MiaB [Coriobacteriia bacterium]